MQVYSILASRQEQEGIQESHGTGGSAAHASHPVTVLDKNVLSPIFVSLRRWAVNYHGNLLFPTLWVESGSVSM